MATTTTSTAVAYCTTDAQFRTIGSAIGSAIVAVNLIKTSDTGQINWTTVLKPTVINTVAGYEMFRFNDSLQSTAPVFIKIEYGIGNYTTSYLGLWITVGTGTDGAGNLTGNISNRTLVFYSNASEVGTRTSYFSGDTNRLCFTLWPSNPASMPTQWGVFGVERSHNTSGTDTGAAVHLFWSGYMNLGSCQYLPLGTTTTFIPPYVSSGWYCSVPTTGGGSLSPNLYTYPIKSFSMYETLPIFNFIHYAGSDFTTGSNYSVTGYDGASRNYYVPGMINANVGYFSFTGTPTSGGIAMRYE